MKRFPSAALLAALWLSGLFSACDDDSGRATEPDSGRLPVDAGSMFINPDASPPDATGLDATALDAAAHDASPMSDATLGPDAEPMSDAAVQPDAEDLPDADQPDADLPDADLADAGECPEPEAFDYACDADDPETCPSGFCVFGTCLAPVLDEDRWADCGDGVCDPCERGQCAADCEDPPVLQGQPRYDSPTTLTVNVHGFNPINVEEFAEETYGADDGLGRRRQWFERLSPDRPFGEAAPMAPNQIVGVEYYGAIPAPWLSPEQRAEIEALDWQSPDALRRYALITAYFIRHKMQLTGATHVNLTCHSMGCHIIRYVIEHDLSGLASGRHIARWVSVSGVIAGARLARLYDNPQVRAVAPVIGLNTFDFIHMHPDVVRDRSARWDHRPHAANNPMFSGIMLHHVVATDPRVSATGNIVRLLDLSNPGDEPNDGIMFSLDQQFLEQAEAVQFLTPDNQRRPPTRSHLYVDHLTVSSTAAAGALVNAGLFHRRKVYITLREVELLDDLEFEGNFEQNGVAPAEISFAARVRYDPYLQTHFEIDAEIHRQTPEDRSSPVAVLAEGETRDLNLRIFEGPVFDAMNSLQLNLMLLEMDHYPRFEVAEWIFDAHQGLGSFNGQVELRDHSFVIESPSVRATVEVRVVPFYEAAP